VTQPNVVRIWLLGGVRASVGSRTIGGKGWRLSKAATLVKLLARAPKHRLHRERAMDLLWPDLGARAASNNLRQVLYDARRILDPASESRYRYLSFRDELLTLCPEGQTEPRIGRRGDDQCARHGALCAVPCARSALSPIPQAPHGGARGAARW
jgi:DNA-binding SARP family transcriptional activator